VISRVSGSEHNADKNCQTGPVVVEEGLEAALAVALAEMVHEDAGVVAQVPEQGDLSEVGEQVAWLFNEATGRALVQTTDPERVREAFSGVAPVVRVGEGQHDPRLDLSMSWTDLSYDADEIAALRATITNELE
jgi:phosphoribosylformylglycinamidine synthase